MVFTEGSTAMFRISILENIERDMLNFMIRFTPVLMIYVLSVVARGWNKDELIIDTSIDPSRLHKYKRTPCSVCNGERFVRGEYQIDENTGKYNLSYAEYIVARYVPIDKYFSPLRVPEIMDSGRFEGRIIDPRMTFLSWN